MARIRNREHLGGNTRPLLFGDHRSRLRYHHHTVALPGVEEHRRVVGRDETGRRGRLVRLGKLAQAVGSPRGRPQLAANMQDLHAPTTGGVQSGQSFALHGGPAAHECQRKQGRMPRDVRAGMGAFDGLSHAMAVLTAL